MEDIGKLIPEKLGKYEIKGELGHGSMAVVYLGHDPFIDRSVAVKVALPKYLQDPGTAGQFKEMFFNEARISGMMDNRFILPVYDAGIEGDLLYIVMEHVEGARTLKEYCSPDKLLPVEKVLELIYKCCRGLEYAHSRDVIHRDIKPSNILLSGDMDVRIADFGIAQIMRPDETQVMEMIGSPRYMSPEQVNEEGISHQTDIYSMGVVLYELLTGHTPFDAESLGALVNRIQNEEAPLLSAYRDGLPPQLEMVVKRALAKKTDLRYPTAMDLASDLVMAFKHQKHMVVAGDSDNQEKFRRLKQNIFFRDFFDSEIWEVISASEWAEARPEDVLVSEGEIDDSFYVIIKGKVSVIKGGRTLARLGEGDSFGEMAYFSKSERTASIVATEDVMLLKVNSTLIEKVSQNCQIRFMRVFLQTLIGRLAATSDLLAHDEATKQ